MLLFGCAVADAPSGPTASLPFRNRAAEAQTTLDAILIAARAGDRPAFESRVAPAFAARSNLWFVNLRQLGRDDLNLRALSGASPLDSDRWSQQVVVAWRPPGSPDEARQSVWLTFEGDRALLAGDAVPGAQRAAPRPSWLQAPIGVQRRGSVTVIKAGRPDSTWLYRGEQALADVRSELRALGGPSWSGPLVVELPANRVMFERSLGVVSGSYARIGAVAWPRGEDADTAAVHVVVNPEPAGRLTADGIAVLLAHEATHVATRSVDSAAPTWLTEGLADYVAYTRHPGAQPAARLPLLDQLRRGRLPVAVPADAAFAADNPDLELVYAQSWSLCAYLAARYGPARFGAFYRSVDEGTGVAPALRAQFGISTDTLVGDWRADIRRSAGPR